MIFVIDVSDENYLEAFDTLLQELKTFSEPLAQKQRIILCNKIDIEGALDRAEEIKAKLQEKNPDEKVLFMSVYERKGLKNVEQAIISLVDSMENKDRFENLSGETALNRAGKTKISDFLKDKANCTTDTDQYPGSEL